MEPSLIFGALSALGACGCWFKYRKLEKETSAIKGAIRCEIKSLSSLLATVEEKQQHTLPSVLATSPSIYATFTGKVTRAPGNDSVIWTKYAHPVQYPTVWYKREDITSILTKKLPFGDKERLTSYTEYSHRPFFLTSLSPPPQRTFGSSPPTKVLVKDVSNCKMDAVIQQVSEVFDEQNYTYEEVMKALEHGEFTKGVRHIEHALVENRHITAIGHITRDEDTEDVILGNCNSGQSDENKPFILSDKPFSEVTHEYETETNKWKLAAIAMGGIAGACLIYALLHSAQRAWAQYMEDKRIEQLRGRRGNTSNRRIPRSRNRSRGRVVEEEDEKIYIDEDAEEGENNASSCVICLENRANGVILDCGHMFTCVSCGNQLRRCPVCRGHIRKIIRVFSNE